MLLPRDMFLIMRGISMRLTIVIEWHLAHPQCHGQMKEDCDREERDLLIIGIATHQEEHHTLEDSRTTTFLEKHICKIVRMSTGRIHNSCMTSTSAAQMYAIRLDVGSEWSKEAQDTVQVEASSAAWLVARANRTSDGRKEAGAPSKLRLVEEASSKHRIGELGLVLRGLPPAQGRLLGRNDLGLQQ